MLMYLRDHNTSQTVIDVFNKLEEDLGETVFRKLFPVVLTDNGSEFSNPTALEANQRTKIFYCDANAPYQKGQIEKNHTLIRYALPKGTSFDGLTQGCPTVGLSYQFLRKTKAKRQIPCGVV